MATAGFSYMIISFPKPLHVILGTLISFIPVNSAKRKKERNMTKEKNKGKGKVKYRLGRARPTLLPFRLLALLPRP